MFEFKGLELFLFCVVSGIISMVIPFILHLATGFCQWVYAWLDDAPVGDNAFTELLYKITGKQYSDDAYGRAVVACFFIPTTLVLPYLALAITIFIIVAFITRMCFRHRKLFDKHVNDKEVHNS